MKQFTLLFFAIISSLTFAIEPSTLMSLEEVKEVVENPSCRIKNSSGTLDIWFCRDSDDKYRCYDEYECEDGTTYTVYGNYCYSSFSDCW